MENDCAVLVWSISASNLGASDSEDPPSTCKYSRGDHVDEELGAGDPVGAGADESALLGLIRTGRKPICKSLLSAQANRTPNLLINLDLMARNLRTPLVRGAATSRSSPENNVTECLILT